MGFGPQINELLRLIPEQRQTLLFSATMPTQLVEFSRAGLRDPETVRLDSEVKLPELLRMLFFTVRSEEKVGCLMYLLRNFIAAEQQSIVFVATRQEVEWLATILGHVSIDCAMVYGRMDQLVRNLNVTKFRSRKARVLLVTDVAARGIDIPLLDNVINFDFPPRAKLFVHRVGRVARSGRTGTAYSFASPDEVPYMADVFQFLERPLLCRVPEQLLPYRPMVLFVCHCFESVSRVMHWFDRAQWFCKASSS